MLDTVLNLVTTYLPDALSVLGALTVLATVLAKFTKNTVDDTVAKALVWLRDKAVWLGTLKFIHNRLARVGSTTNSVKRAPAKVRDQRKRK